MSYDPGDVEAERRRIAELLNRDVLDPLKLLLSQAAAYEQTFANLPQARMVASVLASLARQIMLQARDLQTSLRPTLLESLGLRAALESLVVQATRTQGIQITFLVDPGEPSSKRFSPSVELALYRAVEAALDRAVRSAQATRATLRLQGDANGLDVLYTDNGLPAANAETVRALLTRIEELGGAVERQEPFGFVIHFEASAALTVQERNVLTLLANGLSNKQIAAAMHISPRTVNFHLDNIYSKLGVNSRTEAVVYALKCNLVRSDPR